MLAATSSITAAQDYYRAVGTRGGMTAGITYRQFLDPGLAYEGIVSFRNSGMQFTILRQRFEPVLWNIADEFFFTYGYGGHVGFLYSNKFRFFFREIYYDNKKFSPLAGMDGYIGIEYHFPGLPLQIGLDYKPFFDFSFYQFFTLSLGDGAFTLKYTF
jgi:hypothetical protein